MAVEYTETLDTILRDTIPQLPGAVRAVVERELRMTMREFFERSFAWQEDITGVDLPAGETPIQMTDAITGDTNADVVGIIHVGYAGRVQLTPINARPLQSETSDEPQNYYMTSNPDEFTVYPYPQNAQSGVLDVRVVKTPKLTATQLPRQTQTKYYDAIVEGLLARMYLHPNKPYSAPVLAQQMRHNFRRRIAYYNAQAKQGYNNSQNWRFPTSYHVTRPQRNG